jgi:hypothetical protein
MLNLECQVTWVIMYTHTHTHDYSLYGVISSAAVPYLLLLSSQNCGRDVGPVLNVYRAVDI